jgi:hypothetical protein
LLGNGAEKNLKDLLEEEREDEEGVKYGFLEEESEGIE